MFDAAVPTDTASSTDWNPSRFADTSPLAGQSPATVGQSPALVGESPTSAQQRCEVLSDEITTLAGHLNAAHMERLVRAYRRCRKQAEAAAGKTEADAAAAETSNEPEPAAIVSAETNGLETSPETGPETDEIVSAETSGGEPESVTESPAPKRTGRATALVHIAEHYLATGGSGARPLTSSEAYQVFVHVNANDAGPDNRINGAHTCYTKVPIGHRHPYPGQTSRSTPSLIVAVPSPNQLAGDFWIGLRRRHASSKMSSKTRQCGYPDRTFFPVGAALAVSGAALQGLFRNPLADPGLIGVSSGAALGAIAMIVLGGSVVSVSHWAPFALPATGTPAEVFTDSTLSSVYGTRVEVETCPLLGRLLVRAE